MLRQHPSSTLFPYTTLFRSIAEERREAGPLRKDSREGALPVEGEQRFAHDERASEGAERQRFVRDRSEEHTSELQSRRDLVCRLLLEKKNESQISPVI